MVEPIKELRKICQTTKTVRNRKGEQWIGPMFYRKFSIYFTKLFLYTPITANMVSMLNTIISIIAAYMLLQGNFGYGIIAIFLIFLADVLDHSDGEIARYKKTAGPKGEKIESFVGQFEIPLYWSAISYAGFAASNRIEFLVAGFITVVLFMRIERLKIMKKDYETKTFHSKPSETFSSLTNPKRFFSFIAFSKYFMQAVIAAGVLLSILPQIVLAYSVISLIGYYIFGLDYLKE